MNQSLRVCLVCCYKIFHILHLATYKVYFITLHFMLARCSLVNPKQQQFARQLLSTPLKVVQWRVSRG